MSYTASKTWVSEETQEFENWVKIRDSMTRIAPKSPFIPRTFQEWLSYKVLKKEDDRQKALQALISKQRKSNDRAMGMKRIFEGKTVNDQLSLVLASKSIWRPSIGSAHTDKFAPWPTHEEYKHEGDYRSRSGYSRFPPLPREPGNETVNWKQRKPLNQHLFDEVGRHVAREDDESDLSLGDIVEFIGSSFFGSLDMGKPSQDR